MDSGESRWEVTLSLLLRPRLLLQGVVEYTSAWFFTRGWFWLAFLYSPMAILLIASIAIVSYGASISKDTLVERYSEMVKEELPLALSALEGDEEEDAESQPDGDSQEAAENPASSEEANTKPSNEDLDTVTAYGELLLRRMLQLNNDNSRATWLVAYQLSQQGRNGQARQMMRRISPTDGGGFAPGHAWLAADKLKTGGVQNLEDWKQFESDMEVARRWRLVNPQLVAIYANDLANFQTADPKTQRNNIQRALNVLSEASEFHPELRLELASLAGRVGRKQTLERVSREIKSEIEKKMREGTETVEDLTQLGNLFLLELDPDRALTVCEMALKKEPDNRVGLRMMSEAYRLKYLQTAQLEGDSATVNLSLLDAALKADPTNPGVSVEVAKLLAAGLDATPELKESLQSQLVSGQATALAHILLANRFLQNDEIEQAVPHLEAALTQAPNNALVLNNLALALARTKTDPENLQRALNLSESALRSDPNNPEYLDTLGEIRWLNGDKLGALQSYEATIGIDPERVSTRESLMRLYRELGMEEMSEREAAEIKRLRASG